MKQNIDWERKTENEGVTVDSYSTTFAHMYLKSSWSGGTSKKHYCLRLGIWCFKNAIECPSDILLYLKWKYNKYF